MSKLRNEFNIGEEVILDKDRANSSIVTVIHQTPNKLFTTVKGGDSEWEVMTARLSRKMTDEMLVYMSDDMWLPIHYKGIKIEQPYYSGDGNHSVVELEKICNQFKEYTHQQQIIKQGVMKAFVDLKFNL
jgi:hypothetical protein